MGGIVDLIKKRMSETAMPQAPTQLGTQEPVVPVKQQPSSVPSMPVKQQPSSVSALADNGKALDKIDAHKVGIDGNVVVSSQQAPLSLSDRIANGEDPYRVLLEQNYNDNKSYLERKRKAALLGDIAQIFGQSAALGIGARQFAPVKSDVPKYNNALDNIITGYNGKKLNLTLSDIKAERDADIQTQKIQLEFEKDRTLAEIKSKLEGGLIDQRAARELEILVKKAENAKELEGIKSNNAWNLAQYKEVQAAVRNQQNNETRKAIAEENNQTRRELANAKGSSSSSSGKESIRIKNDDGTYTTVQLDKSNVSAVNSLYDRMKEILAQDAAQNRADRIDELESLKMQFGEGGDQKSKNFNIVSRMMQYFPELNKEFMDIVGSSSGQSPADPKAKTISGFESSENDDKKKIKGISK